MRLDRETIRFLFRSDEGTIDQPTWRFGALVLGAILVPLILTWFLIAPATHQDIETRTLFDAATLGAFVYLLLFAFTVILIAVSWTNLGAKRFRATGWPAAFAAGVPLAALFDGAAHWLQPRVTDVFPAWLLILADLVTIGVSLWTLYELGFAAPAPTASK
ncbi:MAG: hypothetical protein NVSMB26_03700 [Beijerinckiaceae bacterium]